MRIWPVLPVLCLAPVFLGAQAAPGWWFDHGVSEGSDAGSDTSSAYAPALLGQAKNLAYHAFQSMEATLAGSAGPEIQHLVSILPLEPERNYTPLSVGQLKAMATPFYNRFAEVGFELPEPLVRSGSVYPWDSDSPLETFDALATLGQLMWVFSFDLRHWGAAVGVSAEAPDPGGTPGDNGEGSSGEIPASWWQNWFGTDGGSDLWDLDGDGLSAWEEFEAGTNPLKPDHPAIGLRLFMTLEP